MRSSAFGICVGALIFATGQAQCEEKIHELRASPTTVHRGFFDATLKPLLTVEPFYSTSALGDKTIETVPGFSVTRAGSDVTTYGVNVMFPFGTKTLLTPFAGIGSAHFTRQGEDETFTSFDLGLGIGFTVMPKFSLDLRGELQAASSGETSRKMANVTLGASYALFSTP